LIKSNLIGRDSDPNYVFEPDPKNAKCLIGTRLLIFDSDPNRTIKSNLIGRDSDPNVPNLKPAYRFLALLILLLAGMPHAVSAHEIPQRVAIIAFVKPEGRTLHVIVRVPLESMRDLQYPLRADGSLDLTKMGTLLSDAAELWVLNYIDFYENGRKIVAGKSAATQLSLPSDKSFTEYEQARNHVHAAALDTSTIIQVKQAMFDMELEYPIASDSSNFSVQPALAHLGIQTTTVLRFLAPGHGERVFQYIGNPGLVALDPRWHQAAWRFIQLGFEHILDGYDHLLFIFCLVIPIRKVRPLAAIVTAFTAAHSITLVASAYGFAPTALWFPPLVESLIAISIVYMALENILGRASRLRHRWMLAFGFGLVHGFGFSFTLKESLQFAGSHLVTSLASFNLGVELGQLFVLTLAVPVLALVIRHTISERATVIVASAIVAHSGWHWMTERLEILSQYHVGWPIFDAVFVLGLLRALLLLAIAGAVAWALSGFLEGLAGAPIDVGEKASGP
ncbi:MAG: HupE/UreJ family protein, partial [Gemmatimonadaceae bacterium]